ncbi:MAG TPA: gamma-glutamyl-gamma-aminobutyrate hydrolase family protein [Pyrinomonadaceae bacterium]|jgi:putative glutamine amidotransferase|nr:gamma-glutamyl-gamma-aminobutyrate hydrolase family protein [Pyrinomonadaceae bacterium]
MPERRPLIGITLRQELATERFYLARFYSEAVEAAGGTPVYLPLIPKPEFIDSIAGRLGGILLPGSDSDVDPQLYGREPQRRLGSVHPLRDSTDLLLLSASEERRIPLLAICYGMQILNVSRGGTLIQDIATEVPEAIKHEQGAPRERPSHRIKLRAESLPAILTGRESLLVNSHHHQALEVCGRDLQATAWSADGLVEAVEDTRKGRWVVGVQWHPEMGWEGEELSRALFAAFVRAARDFASDNADS